MLFSIEIDPYEKEKVGGNLEQSLVLGNASRNVKQFCNMLKKSYGLSCYFSNIHVKI